MALLNYTTKIEVEKTIGEIQKMLSVRGATSLKTDYENGFVTALAFQIKLGESFIAFRLPCDWRPVLEVMKKDPKVPRRLCDQVQAVRVAWRIVKDWVQAQMALVDTRMAKTEEIFLPYAITNDGRTLAEKTLSDPKFLLESGN